MKAKLIQPTLNQLEIRVDKSERVSMLLLDYLEEKQDNNPDFSMIVTTHMKDAARCDVTFMYYIRLYYKGKQATTYTYQQALNYINANS